MNPIRDEAIPDLAIPPPGKAWVVLHVRPRCEKKLEAFCQRSGLPAYLPLRRKVHRYGVRERAFWSPLFPGYLFCVSTAPGRSTLRQNRYVANLLEVLDQARLVGQLLHIRQALAVDDMVEVMPYLAAGRRVQVTAGPFKGLEGIVQRIKGRTKVVLNVDMIQQAVIVEVDSTCLAPA
ncbi:MAG: hypothetical protein KJ726_09640 [Verrucomicrobia bacterium]|nr:hypothetical protein [Verrucomicrobiota bacterium]MBU1910297.1 hypothetical protein [Verrucomicrobiota bacterium]